MNNVKPYPVNFADCYVLTNNRTKVFITSFLNAFLLNRQEVTNKYEIPQFSKQPVLTFNLADTLIDYLEKNQHELHAIYWRNKEVSALRGAMCIFTGDGQVIVGLYCETLRPDTRIEQAYLKKLMHFCNSTNGLVEYEQPAAQDTDEFLQRLKNFQSGMGF